MIMKLVAVAFASLIAVVSSFSTISRMMPSRVKMMAEGDATETPKEWVGAKKFSMKDRYTTTVLSSEQISKILPHRYPFLLVDRVVEFEAGKRAVGIKCITSNEPQCKFLQSHVALLPILVM